MAIKQGQRKGVLITGVWLFAVSLGASGLATAASSTDVDSQSTFTTEKGSMVLELNRGGIVPFEVSLIPTGSSCQAPVKAEINWDKKKDSVNIHLTGTKALFPYPTVDRTEGVSWFPNKFIPEPEDYTNGRYQLWLLSSGAPINMYYDSTTLELIGSEFDFTAKPASAVAIPMPTVVALPMQFFEPDQNGNVDVEFDLPYAKMSRGDAPGQLGYHLAAFPPFSLCSLSPLTFIPSAVRPYVTAPLPLDKVLSFEQFLTGGLFLDVTVEPPHYFIYPPKVTMTASVSGSYTLGGSIPRGYTVDNFAQAAGVAPMIRPFAGAGKCEMFTSVAPPSNINSCAQLGVSAASAAAGTQGGAQ